MTPPPGMTDSAIDLIAAVRGACIALGREDMESRLALTEARIARPDAVVVLAGEFKKGKSSLANALIGVPACPVDDDITTAVITVLRHGEQEGLTVHGQPGPYAPGDAPVIADIADYATERGVRRDRVESVEVRISNPLLSRGLTIVDTPGVGTVDPARGSATLGFLASADGLIFVTDASAQLSAPEADFLERARDLGPVVLVALTKIDLFPEWRRIADIDEQLLHQIGLPPPIPVSAHLRARALLDGDLDLNLESGMPSLLANISRDVLGARQGAAIAFARANAEAILTQLRMPLEAEVEALEAAATAPEARQSDDPVTRLTEVRARVAHIRGPGSRWQARLSEGFQALGSDVDHRLRTEMRAFSRAFEDELESIDPASQWDEFSGRFQAAAAQVVQDSYARLILGVDGIHTSLLDLLGRDGIDLNLRLDHQRFDVRSVWTGPKAERATALSAVSTRADRTFGALRGAQAGIVMLGVVGQLAGLTLAGPVVVGAAAVFAARQVVEDRRKRLTTRRQEARTTVRQFVDDVQFEVAARIRDLARDLQQRLRDDLGERLEELLRTYGETARILETDIHRDEAQRETRSVAVRAQLATLNELETRLAGGDAS